MPENAPTGGLRGVGARPPDWPMPAVHGELGRLTATHLPPAQAYLHARLAARRDH